MFCIAGFDGYFKSVNSAWEKALGFSREELLARPFLEFVHSDDIKKTAEEAERLTSGASIAFENRYLCKDGSYRWLSWSGQSIASDKLILAVARDITAQKNDEAKLVEDKKLIKKAYFREKLRRTQNESIHARMVSLFDKLPAIAGILRGPQHFIEFANEGWRKIALPRVVQGKMITDAFPGLDEKVIKTLNQVYQSGERFVGQEFPIAADWTNSGVLSKKYFTFILEPTFDFQGKPDGVWMVAFDLPTTENLSSQFQISKLMASWSTFTAGVVQEMNLPLLSEWDEKFANGLKFQRLEIQVHANRAYQTDSSPRRDLGLTMAEFRILYWLASNPGTFFTVEDLKLKLWPSEVHVGTRTVYSHIYTLRKKLGSLKPMIECERSKGYQFIPH